MFELGIDKPLNIALDFDDTYTADPELWDAFIQAAKSRGHTVHIVTMRNEKISGPPRRALPNEPLHLTDLRGKCKFMKDKGIDIDIWIDDKPNYVLFYHRHAGIKEPYDPFDRV